MRIHYRAVTSTRTAFIVGHHVINERSVRLLEPSGYWWQHDILNYMWMMAEWGNNRIMPMIIAYLTPPDIS